MAVCKVCHNHEEANIPAALQETAAKHGITGTCSHCCMKQGAAAVNDMTSDAARLLTTDSVLAVWSIAMQVAQSPGDIHSLPEVFVRSLARCAMIGCGHILKEKNG